MTRLAQLNHLIISIHALRVEGDSRDGCGKNREVYFYPRPPCGGRHQDKRHQQT